MIVEVGVRHGSGEVRRVRERGLLVTGVCAGQNRAGCHRHRNAESGPDTDERDAERPRGRPRGADGERDERREDRGHRQEDCRCEQFEPVVHQPRNRPRLNPRGDKRIDDEHDEDDLHPHEEAIGNSVVLVCPRQAEVVPGEQPGKRDPPEERELRIQLEQDDPDAEEPEHRHDGDERRKQRRPFLGIDILEQLRLERYHRVTSSPVRSRSSRADDRNRCRRTTDRSVSVVLPRPERRSRGRTASWTVPSRAGVSVVSVSRFDAGRASSG